MGVECGAQDVEIIFQWKFHNNNDKVIKHGCNFNVAAAKLMPVFFQIFGAQIAGAHPKGLMVCLAVRGSRNPVGTVGHKACLSIFLSPIQLPGGRGPLTEKKQEQKTENCFHPQNFETQGRYMHVHIA